MRALALALALTVVLLIASLHAQQTKSVGNLPVAELERLAENGDPAAQNELGVRYRLGNDVEKSPTKAVQWYLKAARQGYSRAYFNLGTAYYNGDGVNVNDSESCVWFTLAADAGDEHGQEALARTRQGFTAPQVADCEVSAATAYLSGNLIKQDYGRALHWYQEAADAKNGLACERLAYMYQRGLGVPPDPQESLKWLKRSADLRYVPAIYELGYMYDKGMGVPRDIVKAKKMYELAAAGGQVEALLALGDMYEQGRGFKQDRQEALAYYFVAAQFGNPDGRALADKLSAQLTPKQVAAAKDASKRIALLSKPPLALVKK